jgi:YYY domain-containing protein
MQPNEVTENTDIELSPAQSDESTGLAAPTTESASGQRSWLERRNIAALLLLLVLIIAAYFRFTGLNWDDAHHLHPDERFLTDTASLLRSTDPITYLKTSESPLNPYNVGKSFYVYGNFPMTATRLTAEWTDKVCQLLGERCQYGFSYYDGIHLVGRFMSALVDLISIVFTFLIGRRLYDWRTGILAALLMALAVLPIQQSHFFTMDNWAAAAAVIAMYAAVRASENGKQIRWWILFGIMLGLSVASRINLAPLAFMAVVTAFIWLARRSRESDPDLGWSYLLTDRGRSDLVGAILGIVIAALFSVVTFRLAQPYAFADAQIVRDTAIAQSGELPSPLVLAAKSIVGLNPHWLANMEEIQNLQSPNASFPPALQWTDRAPVIFPLINMVVWGMGIAAGIACLFGFFWALWRIIRAKPDWTSHLLLVSWIGLYFVFMSTRWVKSIRYFLPLYPFLFLLGSWALIEIWNRAGANLFKRVLAGGLIILVVVPTYLWADAFIDIYRSPVTRVQASEWMFENIPSGATLIYESDGEEQELQLPLRRYDFYPGSPPVRLDFTLPEDGILKGLRFNYLRDTEGDQVADDGETLIVSLANLSSGLTLSEASQAISLGDEREPVFIELPAIELESQQPYVIHAEAGAGGGFTASTSRLANEHWDDALPVRIGGLDPYSSYFEGLSEGLMPITHPDSENKRQSFYRWLDEADYIVLSSQRALWSIPRLPLTYPLTTRYYEALFSGELGFEPVAQFHADMNIGPLYISDVGGEVNWGTPPDIGWPPANDFAAEEAFSVYDHPPVWLFEKTDAYDPEQIRRVFEAVDLSQVLFTTPGQATSAPNGLLLDSDAVSAQLNEGTFNSLFNVDGPLAQNDWLAAVVWWLAVIFLGLITFPLTFVVLGGLSDRGYPFARVLGILLISYFGWILASVRLLPNTRSTLLLGLGLLIAANLIIAVVKRVELISFIKENFRLIAIVEIVAVSMFIVLILVRLGNPDAWDVIWGGEKPMDLSYFNAVLKSSYFPPYDPWFAGGVINYYYYGFVFVGVLTKLLGILPTISYNLILPTLFSFTGMGAFSLAYNLVVRRRGSAEPVELSSIETPPSGRLSDVKKKAVAAGIAAAMLCIILGNLAEVVVVLNTWNRASDMDVNTGVAALDTVVRTIDGGIDLALTDRPAPIYPGDWFWSASRAINAEPGEVQPITEFPFFTFLYGDLHAHMIALPLTLLALAWAVSFAFRADNPTKQNIWENATTWIVGGLAIGVLWPTNSWDFPTYLLIGVIAVIYGSIRKFNKLSLQMVGHAAVFSLLLVLLSVVPFLPFTSNFGQAYSSISLWPGSYTHLSNYLVIYGLFLFFILTYMAIEFRSWTRSWTRTALENWKPFALPIIILLVLLTLASAYLVIKGYLIVPVALPLAIFAGVLAIRPGISTSRRIVLVLISGALTLTLIVEFIVLDGDIGRMNTVFKFYLQVWVMLSIVSGVSAVAAWSALKTRPRIRRAWSAVLVLLLLAAALYPILATKAKWDIRMNPDAPKTLDSMAFMQVTSYNDVGFDGSSKSVDLSYDYDAIRWMQRNIEGTPVIAEAHGANPYRSVANRVAMYTGLQAIVGWDWHQRQQRAVLPGSLVTNRIIDVNNLYNTTDINQAMQILKKYDVNYVYAGQLEWTYYHPRGLLKFDEMVEQGLLDEVYRNGGVSIYEVLG